MPCTYNLFLFVYILLFTGRKKKKDLSKVTSRHLRRMVHNEFSKIRKLQNVNETPSYQISENILTSNDTDTNIDVRNNVHTSNNIYSSSLKLTKTKYININKDMFQTQAANEIISKENKISLADKIAHWTVTNNISHNSVNKLLSILRSENLPIPKDCRTLVKTPLACKNIIDMPPGAYIHFGIERGIIYKINQSMTQKELDFLLLTINIDGLPLSKSSNSQFWPILMSIDIIELAEPFIVGIYHGMRKPESVTNFLDAFVNEYLVLKTNGILINNKLITIELKKIICDALATAFVLQTKSHTGYYSCNKYVQKGKYIRCKMTFPKLDAALQNDKDFILQSQQEHHKGYTPLEKIGIGLVSNVPLDYMHLVCLGV